MRVFDCHHGVGNQLELNLGPREHFPKLTMDEWLDRTVSSHLARLDASAIDLAAIHAGVVYRRTSGLADTRRQNDYVALYRNRAGGRLPSAFGVAEPLYADDS